MEYNEKNKRKNYRQEAIMDAFLITTGNAKVYEATAVNVSERGLNLCLDKFLARGENCSVVLDMSGNKTEPVAGQVRWAKKDGDMINMGIEFSEYISEDNKAEFFETIERAIVKAA